MAIVSILPYNMGSESAKALAISTGFKRLRREGSVFKGHPAKVVINWGCSAVSDDVAKCTIINRPECVEVASNKLKCFVAMHKDGGVNIPPFTVDRIEALGWLENGSSVVVRTILNGNSGAGIVLADTIEDDLPVAPLYVKYIPKKQEYRIHVRGGEVVDVQRKARRKDLPDDKVNWKIRNHDNGFVFARNDFVCPDDVKTQALNAVKAVGLDFGAVDVIFNDKEQKAYVLEINTAPGLTGTTLEGYVEAFLKLAK